MPTDSKDRSQLELLPPRVNPYVAEVTPELIRSVSRQPTLSAAWNLAQNLAALEDKQVYTELDMDASHWTKIRKGLAWPPTDKRWNRYMDIVRNEIPLIWAVESRGYDWMSLRKHRSDEARRIEELEEENAALKRAMSMWAQASRGGL